MAKRIAKPKKHIPTEAELLNDPSLKWCGYRKYETVFSDTMQTEIRFLRYEGDSVVLAGMNTMEELPTRVPILSIRRLTAQKLPELLSDSDRQFMLKANLAAKEAFKKGEK